MLFDILRDAKSTRRRICVSWLDLKNAYGSVRHSLIRFALEYYYFPQFVVDLVLNYYDKLCAKVVTDAWETNLFAYDIGVFQGCTLSTILFNVVFNLLYESIKHLIVKGYATDDGIEVREQLFADDITNVTGPKEHQVLLNAQEAFLTWTACLAAKPSKCKSLALTSFTPGHVHRYVAHQPLIYSTFDPVLTINGELI